MEPHIEGQWIQQSQSYSSVSGTQHPLCAYQQRFHRVAHLRILLCEDRLYGRLHLLSGYNLFSCEAGACVQSLCVQLRVLQYVLPTSVHVDHSAHQQFFPQGFLLQYQRHRRQVRSLPGVERVLNHLDTMHLL